MLAVFPVLITVIYLFLAITYKISSMLWVCCHNPYLYLISVLTWTPRLMQVIAVWSSDGSPVNQVHNIGRSSNLKAAKLHAMSD